MTRLIHPTALVETDKVGPRTRIWANVHIMPESVIGADCNICDGVFIESGVRVGNRVTIKNNALLWYGVTLEDNVFVGPGVVFTNDLHPRVRFRTQQAEWLPTVVRSGASIGANATVLGGIEIGPEAMIGAGSVVVANVLSHALVIGNPARFAGWVCECGRRLPEVLVCPCGRSYLIQDGIPVRTPGGDAPAAR